MREIVNGVRELLHGEGIPPLGLGIGVAGQIDPAGETVCFAPNLSWHDIPLQFELQKLLELPVALLNDVRAAILGEWLFGAGKGSDDLICLFVGTGIGGSAISGGRILYGHSNCAGEFGCMTVDLHGPLCHCGNHGCLEAFAGGWAIARRAVEAVAADPLAGKNLVRIAAEQGGDITASVVAVAALAGDPLAGKIVTEVSEALIAGVVNLVNAFNPERLILGGGVIEGLPNLVARISQGVKQRALKVASTNLQVLHAELHNDAGVIGAAAFALQRFGELDEASADA